MQFDLVLNIVFFWQFLDHQEEIEYKPASESRQIPVLRIILFRRILFDSVPSRVLDHLPHLTLKILTTLKSKQAEVINDLALLVHNVIVVEQSLTRLKVVGLHSFLSTLNRLGNKAVGDHLSFFRAPLVHHICNALGPEEPHEIIFEREVELRSTRVSLAPGAAP